MFLLCLLSEYQYPARSLLFTPSPPFKHHPSSEFNNLINKRHLRQRQRHRRLSRHMNPISLNPITLRINLHLRSHIVKLHIRLPNAPTILDGFDAFLEFIRGNVAAGDGGGGYEEDGGGGDERREHGAGDDGLNGGD